MSKKDALTLAGLLAVVFLLSAYPYPPREQFKGFIIVVGVFCITLALIQWQQSCKAAAFDVPARQFWDDSRCSGYSPEDFIVVYWRPDRTGARLTVRDFENRLIGEISYENWRRRTLLIGTDNFEITAKRNGGLRSEAELTGKKPDGEVSVLATCKKESLGYSLYFSVDGNRSITLKSDGISLTRGSVAIRSDGNQIGVVYRNNWIAAGNIPLTVSPAERLFIAMSCHEMLFGN